MLPPIYNYTPSSYTGESQNWKICQADNKKMYFANNAGLLEYNGAVWKKYPSPNKTIVRSVNAKGSKIFTGGFSEFGYWEANEFGELEYTSLSQYVQPSVLEGGKTGKACAQDAGSRAALSHGNEGPKVSRLFRIVVNSRHVTYFNVLA